MSITPKDTNLDTDRYGMQKFPVYQYGSKFCFRADVKDETTGKRKQVRRSYNSEIEAIAGYLDFLKDQERFLERQTTQTVADLIDWWLRILEDEGRKPTTVDGYRAIQNLYTVPTIGDIPATRLTADHLRAVYRTMVTQGLSTATISAVHRGMKSMLNRAVREDKLTKNVAALVTPPKGKAPREHVILTPDQIDTLLKGVVTDRLAACWVLVISTGMRRGELAGLTWDQIDFTNKTLLVDRQRTATMIRGVVEGTVKTDASKRIISLDDVVFDFLRDWKVRQTTERMALGRRWDGGNYVFTSRDGAAYNPHTFNKRFQKLTKAAGVPVLPLHHMRHTFITNALRAKVDTSNVAPYVGHAHGGITAKLYHKVDHRMSFEMLKPAFDRMFLNVETG